MSGGDAARVFAQIGPETLPEMIKALEGALKTDASERMILDLWAFSEMCPSHAMSDVTRALTHANASVARSYFWSKAYLWRSSSRRRVAE